MNLEQLLDPRRLADIWTSTPIRAPEPRPADIEPAAEPGDAGDAGDAGAPARPMTAAQPAAQPAAPAAVALEDIDATPPPPLQAFQALEREIGDVFGVDTKDYAVLRELLDPMARALPQGDVSAADLDQLEELLDALLAARGWPTGTRAKDAP